MGKKILRYEFEQGRGISTNAAKRLAEWIASEFKRNPKLQEEFEAWRKTPEGRMYEEETT